MKIILSLFLFLTLCSFGQDRMKGTFDAQKNVFTTEGGKRISPFRYGLAPYSGYANDEYLYGVIDTTGKIIVPPTYYEIEGFGGGISRITKKAEPWEITYGFIDTLGNEILAPVYSDADDWFYRSMRFAEVLVVAKNGKYGVFDYSGKKLTPLKYQSIWEFHGDRARVYLDGKCGFIDITGNEVIPCQFEEAKDFSGTLALVKKNGKYGWIDPQGKTLIPFEYEWASNFVGEWAKVKKKGKTFFIDINGEPKQASKYESMGSYSEGLAPASKAGKWGFIDSAGNVVIPFTFKKVGNFVKGRAWVWKGKKWGHIDRTGKVTTPIIYDRASQFGNQYTGDSLFASVQLDGKYGKVGINGNLAIPCEYIGIDHFSMGVAKVKKQVGDTKKVGFVNYSGEEIVPCIYDEVGKFQQEVSLNKVRRNGLWGLVNLEGKEVVECKYKRLDLQNDGTYAVWYEDEQFSIDKNGNRIEK